MTVSVLVLYDPKGPAIERLALAIARGVESQGAAHASLRTTEQALTSDLMEADALLLGSPNWSGVTGTLKSWLDEQGTGWGRHSGVEMTLLQIIHWMLACGMVIVGLPWSERMKESGSYYGATATAGVAPEDLIQAEALGLRVAELAAKLKG